MSNVHHSDVLLGVEVPDYELLIVIGISVVW